MIVNLQFYTIIILFVHCDTRNNANLVLVENGVGGINGRNG